VKQLTAHRHEHGDGHGHNLGNRKRQLNNFKGHLIKTKSVERIMRGMLRGGGAQSKYGLVGLLYVSMIR
jgi:hypothetical protein